MKELLKRLEEAERRIDEIETLWDEDPENEEIENRWNKAYEEEAKAFDELKKAIVKFTNGKVDEKTARAMLMFCRDEIANLIEKVA